jgi:hypothetical protein
VRRERRGGGEDIMIGKEKETCELFFVFNRYIHGHTAWESGVLRWAGYGMMGYNTIRYSTVQYNTAGLDKNGCNVMIALMALYTSYALL